MDALEHLLAASRGRDVLLHQTVVSPPWSMRIEDQAPLAVFTLLGGGGVLSFDDGEQHELDAGDVVIVRGPDNYVVADALDTPVQLVISAGNVAKGRAVDEESDLRTCKVDLDGSTVVLSGTYGTARNIDERLTNALPRFIHVKAENCDPALMDIVLREVTNDQPAQQMVLDRLTDLLLVTTLRSWFTLHEDSSPGWYRAALDPVLGPAMRAIHDTPHRPWTVVTLAALVNVSRAGFAKRFVDVVGVPPMTYLSNWRIAFACNLLVESNQSLEEIAQDTGYSSAFAFSAAFKRHTGESPAFYRQRSTKSVSPVS